ncbi:MAG: radical SAM protein [Fibrobacter sp.]|nr:radical SAM protein [Fibrobacter sp.]
MNLTTTQINQVAVIVPPIEDFYFTPHRFTSIGATIVVEILKKRGIKTRYFNFPQMYPRSTTIPIPREFNYLKKHIIPNETGKCSYFTSYKRFGQSVAECTKVILDSNPQLCFFSCFSFCYSLPALKLAEEIKRSSPSTIIIFGGAGVSAYPEFFLRSSYIDYTLSGEAEINLPDFLDFILSGEIQVSKISGFGWKSEGKMQLNSCTTRTADNDIQCSIVATTGSGNSLHLTTTLSRGCPLRCSFCSNWLCHGKEFRRVSLSNLEDSLQKTIHKVDLLKDICVNFEDDNLLLDYEFFKECIAVFKRYIPGAKFLAENGIDYRLMDAEKCRELISLGLSQFNFSLGSTDLAILVDVNRSGNTGRYDELLSIASENSIPVITYFICGFKQDTIESVARNLSFLYSRKTFIGISLYYPVPGIAGYEDRLLFDKVNPALCCGSAAFSWNNSLTTETLVTAFRLARFINLTKSVQKSELEIELIDSTFKRKKLHTITKEKDAAVVREVPVQDEALVELFFESIEKVV